MPVRSCWNRKGCAAHDFDERRRRRPELTTTGPKRKWDDVEKGTRGGESTDQSERDEPIRN